MMTVNFGTTELATACTILAPSLAMPARSYWRADDEAGDVLQEDQRDAAQVAQLDEVRGLQRRLENSTPLFATMPTRKPWSRAKPVTQRRRRSAALNSSKREPSTSRAMTSRTSYGLRVSALTMP